MMSLSVGGRLGRYEILSYLILATVIQLLAFPLFAQMPTGTVSGRVVADDAPLAGVAVDAESSSLQGARSVLTTANGDYLIPLLPPGEYTVAFSLDGYRKIEQKIKVSAAQTIRLDAEMAPAELTGEVIITSRYETISSTNSAASTFEKDLVEQLAMPRTFDATVLLAPGTNTGMGGHLTISGSLASENQFMINGVSAMDNLFGFAHDFYIEDAIEETTVQSSGISAEYGRFAGGVVNMITRSGSNTLHGSYRLSLENDNWAARTPLTEAREDEIATIHEVTLGGPLWQDRIWFFLAGRADPGKDTSRRTFLTNVPFTSSYSEDRWEAKVTISPHASHRFTASYIEQASDWTNTHRWPALDLESIDEYEGFNGDLGALHYSGVITDSLFVEAQYSAKASAMLSLGREGFSGDLIRGTLWLDVGLGWSRANMPGFDGDRTKEDRDNTDLLVKGTVFLSNAKLGSHELVFGYDTFDDMRDSDLYQSPSDFAFGSFIPGIIDGQDYYPRAAPGATVLRWLPIELAGASSSLVTESLFLNDTWRVSDKLTLNLGLRYESNDGRNSDGAIVADDSRLSPRLGATFDPRGDGTLLFHGSFGRYVAALSNGVANDTAAGGFPAIYDYLYLGESINLGPPPYVSTRDVIEQLFTWFDAQGGTGASHLLLGSPDIPGLTRGIPRGLKSPYTDEITIGVTKRFGDSGTIRADYVRREAHDFYAEKVDLTTGQVTDEFGNALDFGEFVNEDSLLERVYDGLHTQVQYRFSGTVDVAGSWTWSHLRGNWEGENLANGPYQSEILSYPEYKDPSWYAPRGSLFGDQRHKLRAWVVCYPVSSPRHSLNVSALLSYATGRPYYAASEIAVGDYVENPGYANPYTLQTYFFSERDAYRTDDITSLDLALNYSFNFSALGADLEVFVQPEVRNLFNAQGAVDHDDTVIVNSAMPFDPWTEQPFEGRNYELGDDFGSPSNETDYQPPREFRVSLGVRF
jgi:hypothetical protein